MNNDLKTQWKVGIFVTLGLVAIMVSITLLGGGTSLFVPNANIKTKMQEAQGLAEGSVISLSGIVIGNVSKIEFDNESTQLIITLGIKKNYLKNIAKDSQVEIKTQGALGDKFIYVIPGDLKQGVIQDGDWISANVGSDILKIFSQRGNETEKIFDILGDVKVLTSSLTKDQRIEKILNSLVLTTSQLEKSTQQLSQLSKNMNLNPLNSSLEKMDRIMTKIDRGDGTLGALINDPSIHKQIKNMLGGQDKKNTMKNILRVSGEE